MRSQIELPKARNFMKTKVVTADPQMGLEQAMELFLKTGVSNAPVVTREGKLVGFISERDCLEHLSNEFFYRNPDTRVGTMMKKHPLCVAPEADIFTLASIFTEHGHRHLPVVEQHELVGIVSRSDVLKSLFDYWNECRGEEDLRKHPPDLEQIINHRFICK